MPYPTMRQYADNSLELMTEIIGSDLVKTQPGGFEIRETGNVLHVGNKYIWTYTLKTNSVQIYWVYYLWCYDTNIGTWFDGGKIAINRMFEDPWLEYYNGTFFLWGEDKTEENDNGNFSISRFSSANWNPATNTGSWSFDGIKLEKNPVGGQYDSSAIYSPMTWYWGTDQYLFYDGRLSLVGPYVEDICITKNVGGILVRDVNNPLFTIADSGWVQNIGIISMFHAKNKYVMFCTALYDYPGPNQRWLAIRIKSANGKTGWSNIDTAPINTPMGELSDVAPFYNNGWYMLYQTNSQTGVYLGRPDVEPEEEEVEPSTPDNIETATGIKAIVSILQNEASKVKR